MANIVKALDKIVAQGSPQIVSERLVKTVATMYPGRLVTRDTNDDGIKVCTAALNPIGWLGYEQATPQAKPATIDTIYVVNDRAPVLNGVGMVVRAKLTTSQTIVQGDRLVADADGMVAKAVAITVDTGSATASAVDATTPTTVGDVGEQTVVGYAYESVTTTGTAADILVISAI